MLNFLKDVPNTYTPETLANSTKHNQAGLPDGRWVACRPLGYRGLFLKERLKAAWAVFCGKADVLRWEGDQ